jgi:hypothetical protein
MNLLLLKLIAPFVMLRLTNELSNSSLFLFFWIAIEVFALILSFNNISFLISSAKIDSRFSILDNSYFFNSISNATLKGLVNNLPL